MHHSPDGTMNFGACYINADYRHVSRYVGRGQRFRLREACCQAGDSLATLYEWRNLRFAWPFLHLVGRLRELRRTLRWFRRDAEQIPQKDLAPATPSSSTRQAACRGAHRGIGARATARPVLQARLPGHVLHRPVPRRRPLLSRGPLPPDHPDLGRGFRADLRPPHGGLPRADPIDRVAGLVRGGDELWEVRTAGGREYRGTERRDRGAVSAGSGILSRTPAAPDHVGDRGRDPGAARPPYRGKRFILFHPEPSGVALVWRQRSGLDQVFCLRPDPDLSAVYATSEIVESVTWETAIVLSDSDWAPLRLESGLYLVGDYNLCGLEDSFITGLCAANVIIEQAGARTSGRR